MFKNLLTNHPLVNILFVVVVVLGAMSYYSMPREQDPEINFNWVNINTALPGASAEDVEQLVTGPLEDAVRNVQDIRWIVSTTRESSSNILVRFRDLDERDFDKRVNDLRRELQNKANDELPDEAEDPYILEVTTSNGFPSALVVVQGQADDEQLRHTARLIKADIERLQGVDKIIAIGLHEPEMQVEFLPWELAARGLLATDIADSLGQAFRDTFAGKSDVAGSEWLVRISGTTSDPEQLSSFQLAPLAQPNELIALDQVAEIRRGRERATQLVSFAGLPAVALSVSKVGYSNTLELVDRINAYIVEKNLQLAGSGISLVLADDQTSATRHAISIMQNNAAVGMLLVLGVCWLFLGLRIATMVTMGIVFSIAGTFLVLDMTGNTLNVSVLLGVVIVLGMLVDDAVVVVEAMYYRLQRGAGRLDAALDSLAEVGRPVTAAVLTTMAAFLPLMLLPGIVGKFMFVIPFVVTVGLAISLVEAFWILPAHVLAFRADPKHDDTRRHWRGRWTHWVRIKYTRMLCYVMRRPVRFLGAGLLSFLLAVAAVGAGMVRMDFFTADPIRLFYVNLDMPADAPLEETLRQTVVVEQRVRELMQPNEYRAMTVNAGIKFTDIEPMYGDQYGQLQVSLSESSIAGRSVTEIINSLREPLQQLELDGEISFLEISGGPPVLRDINVKVRTDDFAELRAATDAMLAIARKIPGASNVADNDVPGRSELALELDYKAVRRAGLSPGQVARLLRLHLDGEIVAFMRDQGEKVELRVRGLPRAQQDISAVLNDPIALPGGGSTTFAALVKQETGQSRGMIRHFNLRRAITVEGDLDEEILEATAAAALIQAEWDKIANQFPNTDLEFGGALDDITESLDAMLGLFLVGLGLIYLIIATQFRSYFQPLLILTTVPMAFTGVVFGLVVTGHPLSLYTLYGIIALTGIAVNSAIVLIDAANARIANGMRPLHATVYAARRRVIPIIMTTSTTIAGLFSLAFGLGGKSLLWGPVAMSIVAGLTIATVLTLFMVPALYRAFMKGHGPDDFRHSHYLD
ncbi:MAG: efflux RND transporter permease subunit [Xanthomonadales bacterium]|nr:efflux RND transporter permease subunit [Xanthomonadales bacterium]